MVTTFWIDNQEFELTIDLNYNIYEVYNYTKQEIIKEGLIKCDV
jgi:hypothetical protein